VNGVMKMSSKQLQVFRFIGHTANNSETSLYPWTLPVLYILHYQPAAWECVQDAASFNPYW
jgi:hypothetical protein